MQANMQGTPLSKPSRIPRGSANKYDSRTHVKPAPDFNKLHSNWEHKLEKNKACRKKPCTLVHEFNLTQPGSKFSKAGNEDDAENERIHLENAYDSSNKENHGDLAQPSRRHKSDKAQNRIPTSGKEQPASADRSIDLALKQKLAGMTFEKDDFALKTILDNTGVAAAFKVPVTITKEKHTVGGPVDKTPVKAVPFRPSTNFNLRNSIYHTRSCPRQASKHVYSEYEHLLRKKFEMTTQGNAVRSPRTTWLSPALPRNSIYDVGQVRGIQTSPKRLGKARRIKLATTPGSSSKASRVMFTTTPEVSAKLAISEVERDDFAVKKLFEDDGDESPEIEKSDDTAKKNVEPLSTKADDNTGDITSKKEASNSESIIESDVQCQQPEFCSWDKPKAAPKSLRITPVSSTNGKAARRVHFQTQSPLNKKNKSTIPASLHILSPSLRKSEQKPQSPLGKRKREDKPSPLRILSPNIPVEAQKVQFPKAALTMETLKKSSLVLQDELVCAGVSPKGVWSMARAAAQEKKPIFSQNAGNQNELLNTTIEDVDYSLSESILQAKQLQRQAEHLQGNNSEEDVQSILLQLEKIERKQKHLQKMRTYLQEQLTLKAKGKSSKKTDQQCGKESNVDSIPKPKFQQSNCDSTGTNINITSPIMTATQTLKKLSIEKETSYVNPTKHTPRKDKVFQYIPALDISPVLAPDGAGSLTNPGRFLSEQETEEDFNVQYIYDIQTTPTDSQSPIKKRLNLFRKEEHDMKTPTKSPTKSLDHLSLTSTIGATMNESCEEAFMQLERLDDQVVPLKQRSPAASKKPSFSQQAVQLANTPRMFSTIQNLDNFISANGGIEGNDYNPRPAPFTPSSSSYITPLKSKPVAKGSALPVCAMLEQHEDLHEHQLLKPCLVNVATQRFRDILLDEEVAMYCDRHSKSPVRLVERCPDPLAEAFMYGDDMHFIPIREDGISSPMEFAPYSPSF